MRKTLRLLMAMLFLMLCQQLSAQRTINGTVVSSADNTPIPGVTVYNKETKKTVITNAAGFFTIQAEKGHTLVLTSVGYASHDIKVGDASLYNLKLETSNKQMGEVVVTAYGINRNKASLGYSTPQVSGEDVSNTQRENFAAALSGRVPGLMVNATSGDPGASSQIILRGIVSIGGDNSPLIVVDGLPIDNSIMNGESLAGNRPNQAQDFTNRGLDINPADIESYVILKGAEATALYGNLGASGAIVITTKKAKQGTGSIGYNNSFRLEKVTNFPEVQQVYSQGVSNGVYSGSTRNYFGPKYPDSMPIYDNIHAFFKTGFTQKHNLAMEGGGGGFSYRWSNELSDVSGTIPNTKYTRFSSRLTGTAVISPILSVTTSLNYLNIYNRKANKGTNGYLMNLLSFPSRYDVTKYQDELGNRVLNTSTIYGEADNPLWDVNKNLNEDKTNRMLGNATLTLKPVKWLTVAGTFGADISSTNGILVYHAQSYRGSGSAGTPTGGRIEVYEQVNRVLNGSLTATAIHKFGQFNNTYIVGGNFSDYNYNTNAQIGEKMYDQNFYSINNTLNTTQRTKLTINRFRGMGAFAQAVLGYQSLLYLTLTGRMDGASRLMPQTPYFFYPAASMAFNFTELNGVKDITWLTSGKLRASFAYTGKEPRYSYATLSRLTGQASSGGGLAYDISNGGNDRLKAEFSQNFETGFEFSFLQGRLGVDFTWYRTKSIDQIIRPRLSYGTGYVLKIMNGGDVLNKGTELQITAAPIRNKDFSWDIVANFATNRGKVLSVAEELPEYYESDTWIQNGVRSSVYPGSSTGALGGWVNDRNSKGQILISTTSNSAFGLPALKNSTDFYPIGDRTPDCIMGFTNKFTYKNFYLSFLWDIRIGGDVYNATQYALYSTGLSMKTLDREVSRVITGVLKDGLQETDHPTTNTISVTPYYNSTFYTSTTNGIAPENFVEKNVNAARLRDITLQYNFSKNTLSGMKWIKDLGMFITATDVLLLTNYSGMDPDSNATNPTTGGLGGYGIDFGNMGRPIGINFGLRAKL